MRKSQRLVVEEETEENLKLKIVCLTHTPKEGVSCPGSPSRVMHQDIPLSAACAEKSWSKIKPQRTSRCKLKGEHPNITSSASSCSHPLVSGCPYIFP